MASARASLERENNLPGRQEDGDERRGEVRIETIHDQQISRLGDRIKSPFKALEPLYERSAGLEGRENQ